ncbi:MAG: hypothetical protein KME26_23680 [Oscillatoria princeps RMCB-10]|jgi:NOL1/NOP2/fmu family ribosome biogenesis protein|nr:hypothetical protein [Oscillatoria princeps RMCB-10]
MELVTDGNNFSASADLEATLTEEPGSSNSSNGAVSIEATVSAPADLLDKNYYRASNEDLAGLTDEELVDHFQKFGQDEGRLFNPAIDLNEYRTLNADLTGMSYREAYQHLSTFGLSEFRQISLTVNLSYYEKVNPDLAGMNGASLFAHLKDFGIKEKRQLSPFVNLKEYQELNPDLANMNGEQLLEHLHTFGIKERRKLSLACDLKYYQEVNPDLADMSGEQLLAHLNTFALKEFRETSPLFSLKHYQEANADLADMNGEELLEHFSKFGSAEGRSFSEFIDINFYKASYAQEISSFYQVDIGQISFAQVFEFMTGAGLQQGISPSPVLDVSFYTGSQPTAEQPPAEQSPAEQSPVQQSPAEQPVVEEQPVQQSPVEQPVVEEQPVELPPVEPSPVGQPTDSQPTDSQPTDTLAGGEQPTDSQPTDQPPSNPELFGNIEYIRQTYAQQLAEAFPGAEVASLTDEQIQEFIKTEGLEKGINPSAFVDVKFVLSNWGDKVAEAAGKAVEQLTYQDIINFISGEGLEQGISPSPFIDFGFYKQSHAEKLKIHFKVEDVASISNEELFEYISGEGLEGGNSPSPLLNLSYLKLNFKVELEAKFGKAVGEISNEELFQYASGAGVEAGINPSPFVRLEVYKAIYAEQLTAHFGVESVSELSNGQIIGFLSSTGLQQGLSPSPAVNFDYIKAVYGEELTAALGENPTFEKILDFISTQGLSEGLNPSPFVNLEYAEKLHKKEIGQSYDVAGAENLSDEQVIESVSDEEAPYIDVKFCREQYATQLQQFYGLATVEEVADISDAQIKSYMFGEGANQGLSLSAFDIEGYISVEASATALKAFYKVQDVAEISQQQIRDFMTGEGLEQKLDLTAYVSVDYYKATYQAALTAQFGEGVADEQVIEFVFGGAAPYIDTEWYREQYATQLTGLATALGKEVNKLSDEEIKEYALSDGWTAGIAKVSAFDIEGYSTQYSTQLIAAYGVSSIEELSQTQIRDFMVERGWKEGIKLSAFVAAEDVELYREANKEKLASAYKIDVSEVAKLSADVVLDFQFGGVSEQIDYDYCRSEKGEELLAYFQSQGVTINSVASITDLQILEYTYSQVVKEGFSASGFSLSGVDIEGYIGKYAQQLAEYFHVEAGDVAKLDIKDIREFIFGEGAKQGLSLEGVVDVAYSRVTYAAAIASSLGVTVEQVADATAVTDAQIRDWFANSASDIDIDFCRYQVEQLAPENLTALLSSLSIQVSDAALLSDKQIIDIAFSVKFKELLQVEEVKLSALDIDGYRAKYTAELSSFFNKTGGGDTSGGTGSDDTSGGTGSDDTSGGTNSDTLSGGTGSDDTSGGTNSDTLSGGTNSDTLSGGTNSDTLSGGTNSDTLSGGTNSDTLSGGTNSDTLSGGTGSDTLSGGTGSDTLSGGTGSDDMSGGTGGGDFDVSSLSDKEVIKFMFHEGWKQGINPLEFVKVDYLRQEFSVELAKHYEIEISSVANLKDELVVAFMYGGEVSEEIDSEFYRTTHEAELTQYFGISTEQISEVQILGYASSAGLEKGFDLSPVNLDGYVDKYSEEIAKHFGVEVEKLADIDKKDIKEFMLKEGLKLGLDATEFVSVDYYRSHGAEKILENYRVENVYNISSEQTAEFMLGAGVKEGLNASPAVDLDWYRTTYAQALSTDIQAIDTDGNAEIDSSELFDYVTGAGLEKGQNPSELIDLASYRAEGSQSAQDLLTSYSATSIEEVSYSETLAYMLGAGLEAGHNPSAQIDLEVYRGSNANGLIQHYGVASIEEVSYTQTFNYMFGAGMQVDGTAMA